MKKVILIGGFHEIIELCESENIEIVGIIDNFKKGNYLGHQILGTDNDIKELYNSFREIPVIISPDQPQKRNYLVDLYGKAGFSFYSLISSNTIISKSAELGQGVLIQAKANISACVNVGNFVRINTMANIMHDSTIQEFTTIAPNAVILGRVIIGSHCYIGANCTILPNITIGNNSVIGAGSVITKDVPSNKTIIGNPGRELVKQDNF